MNLIERNRVHHPFNGFFMCEEARLLLNPCQQSFDPCAAEKILRAAIFYTPNSGDTWVELLRCIFINQGIDANVSEWIDSFIAASPYLGESLSFLGGSQGPTARHGALKVVQTLKDEMRLLMTLYKEAAEGHDATSPLDFFEVIPSFCRCWSRPWISAPIAFV